MRTNVITFTVHLCWLLFTQIVWDCLDLRSKFSSIPTPSSHRKHLVEKKVSVLAKLQKLKLLTLITDLFVHSLKYNMTRAMPRAWVKFTHTYRKHKLIKCVRLIQFSCFESVKVFGPSESSIPVVNLTSLDTRRSSTMENWGNSSLSTPVTAVSPPCQKNTISSVVYPSAEIVDSTINV